MSVVWITTLESLYNIWSKLSFENPLIQQPESLLLFLVYKGSSIFPPEAHYPSGCTLFISFKIFILSTLTKDEKEGLLFPLLGERGNGSESLRK